MLEAHNSHVAKVKFPVLTEALIAGPLSSKSLRASALKAFLVVVVACTRDIGAIQDSLVSGPCYRTNAGGIANRHGLRTLARRSDNSRVFAAGVLGLPVFAGGAFGIATFLAQPVAIWGISDHSYCHGRSRGARHGSWYNEHCYSYDDWKHCYLCCRGKLAGEFCWC